MAMEMALSWGLKREPEMGPQISLTCDSYRASAADLSGTKGLPILVPTGAAKAKPAANKSWLSKSCQQLGLV